MKKSGLILLLALLLCGLVACSSAAPADQPVDVQSAPANNGELLRLALATGPTSGNYYPFGGALSNVVDEGTGYILLDVRATEASSENIQQLSTGQTPLAIVQNDVLHYAFHSLNMWAEMPPLTNVSTLMTLYPEICQLIVPASSDIVSVEDLYGRRVALGGQGSALSVNAEQILAEYNLTTDDIQAQYLTFADAAQAMKDRTIDALFVTVGTPNKGVMDLQAECPVRVISLGDEAINSLIEKYPFYTRTVLTANDYSFLGEEEISTIAVRSTLVAASSLDEQAAYDIVRAIIEGQEKLEIAHAKGSFVNAESAVSGLSVELHPGARRYFTEIGVL